MNLQITYHSSDSRDVRSSRSPATLLPLLGKQVGNLVTVASSGSAGNAAAVTEDYVARLLPDANCRVSVGVDAVATNNHMQLLSGQVEYFLVRAGERISVLG